MRDKRNDCWMLQSISGKSHRGDQGMTSGWYSEPGAHNLPSPVPGAAKVMPWPGPLMVHLESARVMQPKKIGERVYFFTTGWLHVHGVPL